MNSQEFYSNRLSGITVDINSGQFDYKDIDVSWLNQIRVIDTEGLIAQMQDFSIRELLSFLQVSHQYYLRKKLPEIEQSLLHITGRFSETHSILTSLAFFFNSYKNKLVKHIREEDEKLFPYIDRLLTIDEVSESEKEDLLRLKTLSHFEENHDPVEDELYAVNQVLFKFSEKKDLPFPFRVFLNQIALFEVELRKHALIEDEVLIPKVKKLEQVLRNEA